MTSISPKVVASTLAAAVATILVYVLGVFGVDVPAPVEAAIVTVLVFVAGYLRVDPDRV